MTEFLPVSSSGHLALAEIWLPGAERPGLLFDVVVHLGTLGAVVWLLRERLGALGRGALGYVPGVARDPALEVERRWLVLIVVACVPTAILGLLLQGSVERLRTEPASVGAFLLATAAILLVSERLGSRARGDAEVGVVDALLVGTAQGLAVLPGLSRSGATIATALVRDLRAGVAVELSMLISLPAILGASLLVGIQRGGELGATDLVPLAAGFAAAFASGYLSLRALMWVVAQRRFLWFAAYCAIVGVGAIAIG